MLIFKSFVENRLFCSVILPLFLLVCFTWTWMPQAEKKCFPGSKLMPTYQSHQHDKSWYSIIQNRASHNACNLQIPRHFVQLSDEVWSIIVKEIFIYFLYILSHIYWDSFREAKRCVNRNIARKSFVSASYRNYRLADTRSHMPDSDFLLTVSSSTTGHKGFINTGRITEW